MNTLASLLGWTVSQLQAWPTATDVQILETEAFTEDQFHFKVRAQLREPFHLQVRFYYNRGHLDYAYQLFDGGPVLRWDNKEDVSSVSSAPHHHHDDQSRIVESPMNGDTVHDWPLVRAAIDEFLKKKADPPPSASGLVRRVRRQVR